MLTRTGWASKFGFILDIRSLSLSEMVRLINSEAPKDAASDKSGLKGFYEALESISIEKVEICAAPLSAVTIFLPESEYHPGGKAHCSMGMEASVEIKILMLTFEFNFALSITEGTMPAPLHQITTRCDFLNTSDIRRDVTTVETNISVISCAADCETRGVTLNVRYGQTGAAATFSLHV
jgi:hypothetical protein